MCRSLCVLSVVGPFLELQSACGSRLLLWDKGPVIVALLERICFDFQPKLEVNMDLT